MVGGSIVAAPLVGRPQPAGQARAHIGFLGNSDPRSGTEPLEAFRQGLRDLGWIENQTIVIDYRWAEGKVERLPALAAELVQLKTDLVVVAGGVATRAAQQATNSVPIVIAAILIDPVSVGFVTSLAHPGGNITGLARKRLELLREAVPKVSRVAVLWSSSRRGAGGTRSSDLAFEETQTAARALKVQLQSLEIDGPDEFGQAFLAMRSEHAGALVLISNSVLFAHRQRLAAMAMKHRMPAMFEFREYAEAGGLIAYGASLDALSRRAAVYVDKILKGAKPGDLPIEQPTKFELVINLKTAKALGLTIQPSLLARADEIIQ